MEDAVANTLEFDNSMLLEEEELILQEDLVDQNLNASYRRAKRLRLNALAKVEESKIPKQMICAKEKKRRKRVYNRKMRYHEGTLQNSDFKKIAYKEV
jgi:hypothetical protein